MHGYELVIDPLAADAKSRMNGRLESHKQGTKMEGLSIAP
jgi:hypothetical protein